MTLCAEERLQQLQNDGFEFIRFECRDIHGTARGKIIPIEHFVNYATQGLNICLIPCTPQADPVPPEDATIVKFYNLGGVDSYILPDLSTYVKVPWVSNTARVICDVVEGPMMESDPRNILKKQLNRLENLGFSIYSGFEMEFLILDNEKKPVFPGNSKSTLRNNFDQHLVNRMLRGVRGMGIDYMSANAEYGPGQYEIVLAPKYGIKMADDAFSSKTTLKEIAQSEDKTITFMSKWYTDLATGNGLHFNHSIWSIDNPSKNLFYDSTKNNLSQLAQWWIAGLIKHSSALSALCAPTLNCYKRLRDHSLAPTLACWGIGNRTTAFRVKCRGEKTTYVENKIASGSANPYLIMAATIAAGLDGIENQLDPVPESKGWVYGDDKVNSWRPQLPRRIDKALESLENDKMFYDAFGDEFIAIFLAIKRYEIALAIEKEGDQVLEGDTTDWERYMYMEFL